MNHDTEPQIDQRVKANGPSAAFGAACLLAFGFFVSGIPTVTNLFSAGDAVFVCTLRIGGVLLMLAALWCWTGMLHALLADAILSTSIGIGLIASALMMMAGGGMGINQVLYIIFGVMFTSAGLRNGRDFIAFARFRAGMGDVDRNLPTEPPSPRITPPAPPTTSPAPPTSPGPGSLAGELRRRREEAIPSHPGAVPLESPAPAPETQPHPEREEENILAGEPFAADIDPGGSEVDQPEPDSDHQEPPPDGFLSSFADEDTPRGL
jgi:hypothetical protein